MERIKRPRLLIILDLFTFMFPRRYEEIARMIANDIKCDFLEAQQIHRKSRVAIFWLNLCLIVRILTVCLPMAVHVVRTSSVKISTPKIRVLSISIYWQLLTLLTEPNRAAELRADVERDRSDMQKLGFTEKRIRSELARQCMWTLFSILGSKIVPAFLIKKFRRML